MTVFLKYAAIRLSLFVVPFVVMVFVGWHPLIAGGLSLIFAALASYIFLRRQKEELAKVLAERAERRKREKAAAAEAGELDESAEDAILDEQSLGADADTADNADSASAVTGDDAEASSPRREATRASSAGTDGEPDDEPTQDAVDGGPQDSEAGTNSSPRHND